MAVTRYYLQNAASGYTPPTMRGAWDSIAGAVTNGVIGTAKVGTGSLISPGETTTTQPYNFLCNRSTSAPLAGARTVSLNSCGIAMSESNAAGDYYLRLHAFVTVGDSDVVRGIIVDGWVNASELSTANATCGAVYTPTSATVTAFAGDRIVIELGAQSQNTIANAHTVNIRRGGTTDADVTAGSSIFSTVNWFDFDITAALPQAPTNVSATGTVANIGLTWTKDVLATGYKVYRDTAAGATTLLDTLGDVASYTDTTAEFGQTYYYRLKSTNANGDSGYSAEVSAARLIPELVECRQIDSTHTDVVFDIAPDEATAETPGNWTMDGGATVSAATVQTDPKVVRLTHSALTWNTTYAVTAATAITTDASRASSVDADWIATHGGWSGVGTATQVASQNNVAHIVYLTSGLTMNVRKIGADNSLGSAVTLGTITEQHAHPGVFYLPDGTVCVMRGGWHTGTTMAVAQSATPYGTDFGSFVELPALASGKPVYAKPAVLPDGTVFVFSHRETVTPVDMLMYRKTSAQGWDSGTWTTFVSGDGGGTRYIYMQEPSVVDMGTFTRIGVTWTVYFANADGGGSQWRSTKAVGYAYSDDSGATWRRADGTAMTLPISGTDYSDTILYPFRDWCSAEATLTYDADGTPYIAIAPQLLNESTSPDTLLSRGMSVLRWTGAAWGTVTITASDSPYSANNAVPYNATYPSIVTTTIDGLQYLVSNRAYPGESFIDHLKVDYTSDGWDTHSFNRKLYGKAAHVAAADDGRLFVLRISDYESEVHLSVLTDLTPPTQPSGVTATLDTGHIDVAWTDASANESGFYVERQVDGGSWLAEATTLAGVTSIVDSDPPTTGTVKYRVAAYNDVGTSAWVESNTVSLSTPVDLPAATSAGSSSTTVVIGAISPLPAAASAGSGATSAAPGAITPLPSAASAGAGSTVAWLSLVGGIALPAATSTGQSSSAGAVTMRRTGSYSLRIGVGDSVLTIGIDEPVILTLEVDD